MGTEAQTLTLVHSTRGSAVKLVRRHDELVVRFGRASAIEATGYRESAQARERVRRFASDEEAAAAYEDQAWRLLYKGYSADPVDGTNHELLAAIESAPDDPDAYLIYADWLTERGSPRGELIRRSHERELKRADAVRREYEWIVSNRFSLMTRHWWRSREVQMHPLHDPGPQPSTTSLHWKFGFVDHATLLVWSGYTIEELIGAKWLKTRVLRFVRTPSGRFLRRLDVRLRNRHRVAHFDVRVVGKGDKRVVELLPAS